MEKIKITEEMIAAAKDYIPLAAKEAWVGEIAPRCFDKLEIKVDGETMPPMYMVNAGLKSRYLMAVFAEFYFCADFKREKDESLMTSEAYDIWAGSHVFNQMEELKRCGSAAVKAKCYNILYDYHDLEKRLSTQISGLLAAQNDAVMRQSQYTAATMKELPDLLGKLKELQTKEDQKNV